jgi:tRNA (guanine26-N2/guanine27-N2)-dimethyltransferase
MYLERKARIKYADSAFLNPHAMFLRDLSIAFVSGFAKRETPILDPTTATGIRGIRFYLETRSKRVTLLDINEAVAKMAAKNTKFNKVKARVLNKSIQEFANTTKERFAVIDLDPFGSVAPYVYDLMKISKEGTCLLATATDTAVLCGAHEKACVRIYDAKPMHNELCQETGIRILLGHIARVAAQFNYGIEPIMSLSYLHYMKVFVRLRHGLDQSTKSVKSMGYAYYCSRCGFRSMDKSMFPKSTKCGCGGQFIISGRLWAGPLHEKASIKKMLDYLVKNKMDKSEIKTLDTIYHELDTPLFYSVPRITKRLGIPSISPNEVMKRLEKKGFKTSKTHFDDSGIKTDATARDIERAITGKR